MEGVSGAIAGREKTVGRGLEVSHLKKCDLVDALLMSH